MIEITCNDRLGKKVNEKRLQKLTRKCLGLQQTVAKHPAQVRVKCNPDDTIGDLKKLIAAQTGTKHEKIVLKKWYTIYKDPIRLSDYEIHDGMNLELYYQ